MQDTTKHYINGQWVASIDGREMAVENPSTEQKIATITLGGVADADAAVAAAKAAFPAWAATDPLDRIAALERLLEVYKATKSTRDLNFFNRPRLCVLAKTLLNFAL